MSNKNVTADMLALSAIRQKEYEEDKVAEAQASYNKVSFDQNKYHQHCIVCKNIIHTKEEYLDNNGLCEDCQGKIRCQYCREWTRKWNWIDGLMVCEDCQSLDMDTNDRTIYEESAKIYDGMKNVVLLVRMYKYPDEKCQKNAAEISRAADCLATWMEAIRKGDN